MLIDHPIRTAVGAIVLVIALIWGATRSRAETLKEWFNSLESPGGGVCCYDYDGVKLDESDWQAGKTYRVIIDGQWVPVPDDRVVHRPNRLGIAFEWHYYNAGKPVVRCFLPGSGT